jgi:hypothetical protein
LEGSQASLVCPSGKSNMKMKMKMSVEQWWNGTDRGKQKREGKILSQRFFVHYKSRWEAGDWLLGECLSLKGLVSYTLGTERRSRLQGKQTPPSLNDF